MRTFVLVVAGLVAVATTLPVVRRDEWWIRIFDFPRAQIFALGGLALAAFIVFWDVGSWYEGAVMTALVLALAAQAYCIFPYVRVAKKEVLAAAEPSPDSTVALLVANVLMSNRQAERFLRLVRDCRPDIVLMLEPDAWWQQETQVLERDYPHTIKEPLDNQYGMLLYSRLPLIDPETKYLVRDGIPSMHMQVRLASGALVWLHCIHPEPPSPTETDTSAPRDAELLVVGREVKGRDTPTIVAGDLNDVAWSYTTRLFQKISGLLDPRRGRGMFNTFHAKIPLMRWPLDHVFHSDHFLLDDMRRLPTFGSDHFAVYTCLVLQPAAKAVQEGPVPDQEDEEKAEEKIEKVGQKEPL
jgi:endonuclease/exonuclease/phosphatase (EEP) superfamily protein YafD